MVRERRTRGMVAAIGDELTDDEPLGISDMTGVRLAETVILVTYQGTPLTTSS